MEDQHIDQAVESRTTVMWQLKHYGQSIWLDFISRGMTRQGEVKRLIEEYGVAGTTNDPDGGQPAIAESGDRDDVFEGAVRVDSRIDVQETYQRIATVDARMAADALRPVLDRTHGADGFATIQISPNLAHDTKASIAEARQLWDRICRPNLMVAVPATREGTLVTEALLAEGINVNATLVFSLAHYDAVVRAYLRAIERSPDPTRTASVVSVPTRIIDTALDGDLLRNGTPRALALRGRIGTANASQIYRRFCGIFRSARFAGLRLRGVRPQRILWANTTTEGFDESNIRYIEGLVGPDTIITLTPGTLESLRQRGHVRSITLQEDLAEADRAIESLQSVGIDLKNATERLQANAVATFAASFERLLTMLDRKRGEVVRAQGGNYV
jgi:transaldolase